MSQAVYNVYLSDHTGRGFRKNITNAVIRLEATRVANAIGRCSAVLDPSALPAMFFKRDARIAIERALPGRQPALVFDTVYLLRSFTDSYTGGVIARKFDALDVNHLLARRRIAYYAGSAQAKKSATAADNLIKAFVRENLGALCTDPTRDLSAYVTVAADLGLAPSTSKACAWRPLLLVCQELAQESAESGTYLAFDLSALSETAFLFATYTGQRGVDRRQGSGNQFVLSPLRGNFENVTLQRDWSQEVTRAYAGAQGVETERNVQASTNATRAASSVFGLIEDFSDIRHVSQTDTTAAANEAKARVRERRPKTRIQGDLIETDGAIYGVHFAWGDYISINVGDVQADCRLDIAKLELTRGADGLQERFILAASIEEDEDV